MVKIVMVMMDVMVEILEVMVKMMMMLMILDHDDEVGDDGHHMQGERSIQRQLGAMMEQVASMCENTLEYSSTPAPRPKWWLDEDAFEFGMMVNNRD